MAKSKENRKLRNVKILAHKASRIPLVIIFVLCAILIVYHLVFWGKIYPGVRVGEFYLGGKTEKDAVEILRSLNVPKTIIVSAPSQEFAIESSKLNLGYDGVATAHGAFTIGRTTSGVQNVIDKWQGITNDIEISRAVLYDQKSLSDFTNRIADALLVAPIKPGVKIEKGAGLPAGRQVTVESGKAGQEVDIEELNKSIISELGHGRNKIIVPFKPQAPKLTDTQIKELGVRGNKVFGKSITLTVDSDTQVIKDNQIAELVTANGKYDEDKLGDLVNKTATQFTRPVQEALFKFESGKVSEFKPAKAGIEVEKDKLRESLIQMLTNLEKNDVKKVELAVPVKKEETKTKTGDVNNLGIRELIGKGTSRFHGSIPSRIHNVALASSRMNGILIAPGETFSFNKALGDVSEFTGYQQAYIIKDGKTILGDGGGVCQVSTTLFRAALNAGLPITERRAHAYRVHYYEEDSGPGLDATVYDPTADLKIKNDTPAHILIQTHADTKNLSLVFELYGTSDGRVATISKSKVWDQVEPPPDLYQDDPSLPTGKVKQIDFKAWGAKASFDYLVVRGNERLQKKTFYSAYRPWQAIFLRGTAPQ